MKKYISAFVITVFALSACSADPEAPTPPETVHAGEQVGPLGEWSYPASNSGTDTGVCGGDFGCESSPPITSCTFFPHAESVIIAESTGYWEDLVKDRVCRQNLGALPSLNALSTMRLRTIAVAAGRPVPYDLSLQGYALGCSINQGIPGKLFLMNVRFYEDTPYLLNCLDLSFDGDRFTTSSVNTLEDNVEILLPTDFDTLVAEATAIIQDPIGTCSSSNPIINDHYLDYYENLDHETIQALDCPRAVIEDSNEEIFDDGEGESDLDLQP